MRLVFILLLMIPHRLAAQEVPSFTHDVAPVLAAKCIGCHAGTVKMGGLDLDTYESLLKGGHRGKAVVPGNSAESRFYLMVAGKLEPVMPLSGDRLTPREVELFKNWIDSGATAPNPGEFTSVSALSKSSEPGRIKIKPNAPLKPQIFSLAYRPDGKMLALGGFQQVRLTDPDTGETVASFTGHKEVVRGVAFSRDGRLLAAGGGLPARQGEVKIWDVEERRVVQTIAGHSDTIHAVVFSPDAQVVATSSYDQLIKLWDVGTGKEIRTLKDHIDAVYALAFTADGKRLVSGAADRSVKVWDVATGERLYTLGDPLDGINTIALHPSGTRIAAGGMDRTLRTWELGEKEGKLLESLIAHQAPILEVAYSADGNMLVSASADKTIKIFRAEDLTQIKTLGNQPDWVMSLQFSPDGSHLAAGRFDGSLSIYETTGYKDRLEALRVSR